MLIAASLQRSNLIAASTFDTQVPGPLAQPSSPSSEAPAYSPAPSPSEIQCAPLLLAFSL